jgi:hypothetical protein
VFLLGGAPDRNYLVSIYSAFFFVEAKRKRGYFAWFVSIHDYILYYYSFVSRPQKFVGGLFLFFLNSHHTHPEYQACVFIRRCLQRINLNFISTTTTGKTSRARLDNHHSVSAFSLDPCCRTLASNHHSDRLFLFSGTAGADLDKKK